MNFKGLAENINELFHRKRTRTSALLNRHCMCSNTWEWQKDIDERVWSIYTDDEEKKMSLTRPSRVIKNQKLNLKIPENPKIRGKSVSDFSFKAEKPKLPARDNKLTKQEGVPKRPGFLRAEPIGLKRPPTSHKIDKHKHVRMNLMSHREFVFVSPSDDSSEWYDDRGPVFGGWTSDSSDKTSCARLRLSILGSSESYREYGGEEGAKPFAGLDYNDDSKHQSHSEGQGEDKSRRPVWSSGDDLQEVVFFAEQFSPLDSDHATHSLSRENEDCLILEDSLILRLGVLEEYSPI